GAQTAYSVAVNNVGNQPTGDLTLTLSGASKGDFTLSKTAIASLAANGSDNFTVVPKTGLSVGIYAATVTVSGANGISASFDLSFTVSRASQTAPAAPTLAGKTGVSVTLNTITGAEYRNGAGGSWQDSPAFDGLTPETAYTFYARMKGGDTHEPSPASAALAVTTDPRPNYGISLNPSGSHDFAGAVYGYGEQTAYSVAVNNVGNQSTGDLTVALSGASSGDFTLSKTGIANLAANGRDNFTVVPKTGLSAGTHLAGVTVSGANGISASFDLSFTVSKASQNAPAAPTLAGKTGVSVTLNVIEGAEYRSGTGVWQDSPRFGSLNPNTEYIFYARMKETGTHEASPASEGLPVSTPDADAELLGLLVNGNTVSIENGESEYMAGCDEISVSLEILSSGYVSVNEVEYDGRDIPLTGNLTVINIRITSGDGEKVYTHRLKVTKSLDAGMVLFQRWDNVISIIRNPQNNGNISDIEGVRWYRDGYGEAVGSDWFIRIAGEVEEYRAEISIAGSWHKVCGVPRTRNETKVSAYPNPVSVGDNLTLLIPEDLRGGYVNVISISGSTVKRKLPVPDKLNTISVADWSPGVYLLNVVGANGNSETVKIIVNN
ncbi:MAG: T9SS type A sorting domain-containing protein, partial [Prevotellaceae bacterium]|nr:T9SS type A sorting domain-containing protein [Prevotellaceae bacterium]